MSLTRTVVLDTLHKLVDEFVIAVDVTCVDDSTINIVVLHGFMFFDDWFPIDCESLLLWWPRVSELGSSLLCLIVKLS